MNEEYLGQGVKYPLDVSGGTIQLEKGVPLVQQSIAVILSTKKGTKFFLPEYGSRLSELLFEPNDEILEDLLRVFIYEAIRDWEKRAEFISVTFNRESVTCTNCLIRYKVLPSNKIDSFIYPFYRELKY